MSLLNVDAKSLGQKKSFILVFKFESLLITRLIQKSHKVIIVPERLINRMHDMIIENDPPDLGPLRQHKVKLLL